MWSVSLTYITSSLITALSMLKVEESFHAPGRSCDPPGCSHVTANVTRSEVAFGGEPLPPFKCFLLLVVVLFPCSVTQPSGQDPPPPSLGTGTRSDFLLRTTTAWPEHFTGISLKTIHMLNSASLTLTIRSRTPRPSLDNVSPVIHWLCWYVLLCWFLTWSAPGI